MNRCAFHGQKVSKHYPNGGCFGPVQWDHVVEKQFLKRYYAKGCEGRNIGDLLGDTRNRVWVCDRHHQLKTAHSIWLPREEVPTSVEEFCRDLDCLWYLDRFYPRGEQDAA